MSMIDRSLDGMAVFSGHVGAILRRRLREVGGIALVSLAMMAALALATWSVNDPSLSHATDAKVHNLLGRPGAIAADLLMQLLGLGSLALILPIAVWGYRLLGHRSLSRERLRLLLWVFGAVLAAAFASSLPRGSHWPLPCGLGGVVGDAMLRLPAILGWCFVIYGAMCVLCLLFVVKYLRETKGKTLEQIESEIAGYTAQPN